jgi:hypothetical protein
MLGHTWKAMLAGLLLALLSGQAAATETVVFESCFDGRGKTLRGVADTRQAVLVRTVGQGGRREIHYNPDILPQLSSNARYFLYGHQCARQALNANGDPATLARQADCIAINTLLDAGLLKYGDLPGLQRELDFSAADWALLPGPARRIELDNCRPSAGDVLRLPPATHPTARQSEWNACVRACADRLWACQKSCGRGACDACQASYDQCKAACGN